MPKYTASVCRECDREFHFTPRQRAPFYCKPCFPEVARRKATRIYIEGERFIGANGYADIVVSGKRYPEHRKIMEDFLERKLTKGESVHHKNGLRSDNRLENLELWNSSHPSGARVADQVAWALAILAKYMKRPQIEEWAKTL